MSKFGRAKRRHANLLTRTRLREEKRSYDLLLECDRLYPGLYPTTLKMRARASR